MDRVKIGIIGCGTISQIYMTNLNKFEITEIVACADMDVDKAKERALEFDIPKACSVEDILADGSIEIVVNLTIPAAHAEISIKALEAGKHVYVEKPLAVTLEEGQAILNTARAQDLLVGSAPETSLGGGIQTCRKWIDEGMIGQPVAASAFMMNRGHEHWHPQPDFYYKSGGGPMFDMGPYYITALIHLLGPIQRVSGSAKISFTERAITSQGNDGRKVTVETPTHITGTMDFYNGVTTTITTSFDIMGGTDLPPIEIYGSEGTLRVPDPNKFGGPVQVRTIPSSDWRDVGLTHGMTDNNRGIGVMDMAMSLRNNHPHRTNGELAYHCLETMYAFLQSSETNRHIKLESTCERPRPMPEIGKQ